MKDIQYQLISRFLEGEASAEEQQTLSEWRAAAAENEKRFQEISFLWKNAKQTKSFEKPISVDVDAALKKVKQQLDPTTKGINSRRRILRFAAAAASIVFAIGLLWFVNSNNGIEMLEVTTLANEKIEVLLPDSSIVWLNENSALSYPKKFVGNHREVLMHGEAIFEVTHNPTKPFIVEADQLRVQVLGTRFNVISNQENQNNFVHVIRGKVQVQKKVVAAQQVILEKGMTAMYDQKTKRLQLTNEFSANQLFWQNKTLTFKEANLEKVFSDLESAYKIKININNTDLLTCPFSGTFRAQTIDEVFELLQFIYQFEITKSTENYYQINKGLCN